MEKVVVTGPSDRVSVYNAMVVNTAERGTGVCVCVLGGGGLQST